MPTYSRRTILSHLATLAAAYPFSRASMSHALNEGKTQEAGAISLRVSAEWNQPQAHVPDDMMGLSYESSQLSAPDFFSAANKELIQFFKRLSPRGVLRLGGNLSEFTAWTPNAADAAPTIPFRGVTPDPSAGKGIAPIPVTPAAIRNLREFLELTNWKTIYGLNLAQADRDRVVAEAKFVAATLGPRLIAFQIGNEPNHYVLNRLRAPGYGFSDYFSEWSTIHSAVAEAVPNASFAGPDVAEDLNWVAQFAAAAPKSVALLTGHHYASGPPSDPAVTVERLLAPNPDFSRHVEVIEAISKKSGLPYVMSETNSCYNAGKQGVSDVFGAALWASDYILQLARGRQSGIYFHGGGIGWYTPIAGGSGQPFEARPEYYGLLFCRDLAGCAMVPANLSGSSGDAGNVSVYAFHHPRRIVVINKDSRDAVVHFQNGESTVRALRLRGSSLETRTGIALSAEPVAHAEQHAVQVPKYSAAILTLKGA